MDDLLKNLRKKISPLTDFDDIVKEMAEYVSHNKDKILLAWYAENGFSPGKAEIVLDRSNPTETRWYIREAK